MKANRFRFRGWSKWHKVMACNDCEVGHFLLDGYEFDDIILMQSTGLLDKNGNEIFEGDVLKANNSKVWQVIWDEFGFANKCISMMGEPFKETQQLKNHKRLMHAAQIEISEYIEIIGNIYENPELLEGAE